jgi:ATP synthase protein I
VPVDPDEKRRLAAYSTVGIMFPASIGVGGVMGYFLDRWLHTSPWLLFVFVLYGIAAGFINLFRVTRRHESKK